MVWVRRGILLIVAAAIVAGFVYALMPRPVPVDFATVDRGALEVTADEEGVTKIRDIYDVSAPIGGYLDRFPLEVGDRVERDVTIVAEIRPSSPEFLDVRTRREREAAVGAATAAVRLAEAGLTRARADVQLAEADFKRSEQLAQSGIISDRAMEITMNAAAAARARLREAEASLELRQSELATAEARLIQPTGGYNAHPATCCMPIKAPVDGVILEVLAESAQVVAAGAPIARIGDPGDMEIEVDLLSSDAVQVAPGSEAYIEGWGGTVLKGRVRRIDPSAFTKVSALGIEEQRVNVILDLLDPHSTWQTLGNEYRVFVRIVTWRSDDVVRVPLAALFRRGDQWTVFKVVNGIAEIVPVSIDHRDKSFAEVKAGLAADDVVILHPSDQVEMGAAVESRDGPGVSESPPTSGTPPPTSTTPSPSATPSGGEETPEQPVSSGGQDGKSATAVQ
jgi:HlyD family secretion protein